MGFRGRWKQNEGFSMVEIAFVMLLIAGMMAITIPAWAGTRDRGSDAEARTTVGNALRVARGEVVAPGGQHPGTDEAIARLSPAEPLYLWVDETVPAEGPDEVSVLSIPDGNGNNHDLLMVTRSESGRCFAVRDNVQQGTSYTSWIAPQCTAGGAAAQTEWRIGPGENADAAVNMSPINWTGPAPTPGNPSVSPVLECVRSNGDGTQTAVWGTNNRNGQTVIIPYGSRNRMNGVATPQPGQPTVIPDGRVRGGYEVTFPEGQGRTVVWRLSNRTSTASDGSRRCS